MVDINKYPKELFQLQQPTVCKEVADVIKLEVQFYNNVDTYITEQTVDASLFSSASWDKDSIGGVNGQRETNRCYETTKY